VADAVLFAAKNAPFLENRFVGVSPLGTFSSFPGDSPGKRETLSGEPIHLLSLGGRAESAEGFTEALRGAGAVVTSLLEHPSSPGRVDISRPAPGTASGAKRRPAETISRDLDLSDPRLLEPWLDNTLLGGAPPAGALLCLGTSTAGKPVLGFSPEEMEGFLVHLGKALNAFAESARAVRVNGHVILIAPPGKTEEGHLIRAAARQMVRTCLAEQHFLPVGKRVRVSLLTAPGPQDERAFHHRVIDILSGQDRPAVEPIPVGPPRP
jgi:hypothetical protein